MKDFETFLQREDNTLRLHLMASVDEPFYGRLMDAVESFKRAEPRAGRDLEGPK